MEGFAVKQVSAVSIIALGINAYYQITAGDFSAGNAGFTFPYRYLPQLTRKNIQKIRMSLKGKINKNITNTQPLTHGVPV